MRKQLVSTVAALIISAGALMPSAVLAWTPKSFVYTDNQSDTYVWITVYGLATNAIGFMGSMPTLFSQDISNSQVSGSIQGA